MALALALRTWRYFAAGARRRGHALFLNDDAWVLAGGPELLTAAVREEGIYSVRLELTGTSLHASCQCHESQWSAEPCAHVWSCILLADANDLLSEAASRDIELSVAATERQSRRASAADAESTLGEDGDYELGMVGTLSPSTWLEIMVRRRRSRRDAASVARRTALPPLYIIDRTASLREGALALEVMLREQRSGGEAADLAAPPGPVSLPLDELAGRDDHRIAMLLFDALHPEWEGPRPTAFLLDSPALVAPERCGRALPLLARTGRLRVRTSPGSPELHRVAPEIGPAWELRLGVRAGEGGASWIVEGSFHRGREALQPADASLCLGGLILTADLAPLGCPEAFELAALLHRSGRLEVRAGEELTLLEKLWQLPLAPAIAWPEALRLNEARLEPRPYLAIRASTADGERLRAELSFIYEDDIVDAGAPRGWILHAEKRRLIWRNPDAERDALRILRSLGFRRRACNFRKLRTGPGPELFVAPQLLPAAVRELMLAGWHVEAEGKLCRLPGRSSFAVRTGFDWFDLDGEVDFGGASLRLPALLAAHRRGEGMVVLDDGSFGILPESWLKRCGLLALGGKGEDGSLRFGRRQVALLATLVEDLGEVAVDEGFERARAEIAAFTGIQPAEPAPGFAGDLRPYQRLGLGWLEALRRFRLGGCLADDMGLGKTIQALALLAGRGAERAAGAAVGPSLVVVPSSLVFNWKDEAARFAPGLRILDHTGAARTRDPAALSSHDVILTTYGTLRSDAAMLREVRFDYVILDEAQAIKNHRSDTAKAARFLTADHRLALSGTPVENRIEEVWSLFQFLNPGMLGQLSRLRAVAGSGLELEADAISLVARTLRPLILRRTKEQVVPELPPKTEQTIFCDLDDDERRLYAELRDHYKSSLDRRIALDGFEASQFHVLSALLRLRQAACHPGLVDRTRVRAGSTKVDLLLERLEEAQAEGHKTLVFSQFTSLLAIVRKRLDEARFDYEYLDGATRDRQAHVERFQTDPRCSVFLISLKAGGLGLNLTAADYIFLLDPWWNPAVEAQAIDRAHRIGQSRPILACRIIARGTVEEKVLELQQAKRRLADSLIRADAEVSLSREDLEMLLS